MSDRAPYSRLYWSVMDDPKFRSVYRDDAAFALWMRLLMAADAMWPAPAPLPKSARSKPLALLVESGIVDMVDDDRYRIHGLDAERNRRKALATTRGPLGDRTVTGRSPDGDLDEKRREETSNSRAETPRDAADVYWQLTGKYPAGRALEWIDNLASTYGAEAASAALAKAYTLDRSVSNLLSRAQDILRGDARKLDLVEREAEKARLAEKRAVPRVEEPWRAELREAIQRQYDQEGAA